tara:strand:- start:6394 stop:7371 length:978 start_codon:yes stop_codon:yes gene_type:complete
MNTWQEQALHHAKTEFPQESCGLVIEVDDIKQYYPCNNLSAEGVNSFIIDPEDWVKAEDIGSILHICHSHPNGDLTPSEEDIKSCDYFGLSWFIFDPTKDKVQELKPKTEKPLLSKNKFIDRERTEQEKGLRKIKVYGRLAELVGWHVNYADVKNIKEVTKYLVCNYPNVEEFINKDLNLIKINNKPIENQEDFSMNSDGDITIIPIVSGAFWFIPAILIGGGTVLAGTTLALNVAWVATLASSLVTVGVSMAVQGVTNMLFPQQQPNFGDSSGVSDMDARENYSFNGIQNVSRSGVAIPLIYGEVFTGSIVVSSGTDTAPVFKD